MSGTERRLLFCNPRVVREKQRADGMSALRKKIEFVVGSDSERKNIEQSGSVGVARRSRFEIKQSADGVSALQKNPEVVVLLTLGVVIRVVRKNLMKTKGFRLL